MSAARVTVVTESGSRYEIDPDGRRFRKVTTTEESRVRTFDWEDYVTLAARSSREEQFADVVAAEIPIGANVLFVDRHGFYVRTSHVVEVSA